MRLPNPAETGESKRKQTKTNENSRKQMKRKTSGKRQKTEKKHELAIGSHNRKQPQELAIKITIESNVRN